MTPEARQAIIEHNRLMKQQRRWAAENRERLDAEWEALPDGRPWTLADHIAGMGPERWAELNAEWEAE